METHDVIVLGLGGVGSSTVAALARQGYRVLGLDQFSPPHSKGSSHGETRVIRKAYFEHPDYVPMLCRAYELWKELENLTNQQLYFPTGLLQIGPADGEVLAGVRRSADEHQLAVEQMSMQEAQLLFPGILGDPNWTAILERDAGYLAVEPCIAAHLKIASQNHASLRTEQTVRSWQVDGSGVAVHTDQNTYRADSLVIAAGPWASECLRQIKLPLQVIRKHVYWYRVPVGTYHASNFPCFFFDTPQGFYYGIPEIDSSGLKVGRHTGGEIVETLQGDQHQMNSEDQSLVQEFMQQHLPLANSQLLRWSGCYYTMTPDQHFILDRLPENQQVTVIAGLSGHGFKFTSVLGEIAAHLSTDRPSPLPIDFLSMKRLSVS